MSEAKSVLRWGGLAGMAAGTVFLLVPVILFGFVSPAPADPAELVMRFPDVRATIALGNFVNFVVNIFASLGSHVKSTEVENPVR
jgi:hypothetical protein